MKSSLKKKFLFSLGFGALVFLVLTIYADAGKLVSAFSRFQWAYAPLILACTTTNYAFRYFKWDYYTKQLDMRPDRRSNLIIFFSAFLMAVTPGKFGEVMKSYLLKGVNNTPIARSAPVILAERLTDFIGLVLLMILGSYVFGEARGAIIFLALFFAIITILLSWRKGSLTLLKLLEPIPFFRKHVQPLYQAYESVYTLLRPQPLTIAIALSVISWFFECLAFWIILHLFETPPTLLKAMFIYAFSTIVGAVSMLPGGLGTTEGSLTGLTQLAGAPKDIAVAATFIFRVATLWYAVIIGVIVTMAFQHRLPVHVSDIDLQKPVVS